MVAKRLLDHGVSIQKLRTALWYLKTNMPDIKKPLADLRFLTDGETIFVITRDERQILGNGNRKMTHRGNPNVTHPLVKKSVPMLLFTAERIPE